MSSSSCQSCQTGIKFNCFEMAFRRFIGYLVSSRDSKHNYVKHKISVANC